MYLRLSIISAILLNLFIHIKCGFLKKHNSQSTLGGLYASTFTPMDETGAVNVSVIPEYAKYLKTCGIDGVVVACVAGEGLSLSLYEKKKLLDAWVTATKPHGIKIMLQVGGVPLPETLELAKYAETIRVDALSTRAPSLYLPNPIKLLVTEIEILARATTLPIFYLDDPAVIGKTDIPEFFTITSEKTQQFKGLAAILDVVVQVEAATNVRVDQENFIVGSRQITGAVLMGFDSFMSAELNIFPGLVKAIISYTKSGDISMARRTQEKLNKLVAAISAQGDYITAMKATLGIVTGLPIGGTRPPLEDLSRKSITEIKDILEEFSIKIA